VHVAVITEPGSGVSRGFGFVHIPDPIAAKAARDALDNHQVRLGGGLGLTVAARFRATGGFSCVCCIPVPTHSPTHSKPRMHTAKATTHPNNPIIKQIEAGGRGIIVRLRTERGQRSEAPPGGGGGSFGGPGIGMHSHGGSGGGRAPGEIDECKLYVAGLTAHATEEPIRGLFGR